jgi:uncharacterized protein (TIGR02466 family)
MPIDALFSTFVYRAQLPRFPLPQLEVEIEDVLGLDVAGRDWSAANYKNGFTSYATANQLHRMSPTFQLLERKTDQHVKKFATALDLDLKGGRLAMTNCWVNVMPANVHHGLHLHPLSVISGTFYVSVPKGSSAIKFEDPRLPSFMAAPPRRERARRENQTFVNYAPKAGSIILFESWLRHEVPLNSSRAPRVSVSFNYGWE